MHFTNIIILIFYVILKSVKHFVSVHNNSSNNNKRIYIISKISTIIDKQ